MLKVSRAIFVLLLCCVGIANASAQKEVQPFEGGLNIGMSVPLDSYREGKVEVGQVLGLAARYNIPYSEWSVGVDIQMSCMRREFDIPGYDYTGKNNNRATSFTLTGDYNFKQGEKINPYVGLGLGVSYNQAITSYYDHYSSTNFAFMPRFGVEFFYHLRIGAGFIVTRKAYNGFFATVGFVIGSRPVKYK